MQKPRILRPLAPLRPELEGEEGEPENEGKQDLAPLKELGEMNLPQPPDSHIHCMTIVGQIEGHRVLPPKNKTTKYEHLIPQLVAIEQNPKIKGLLVILNTVGGDIEAGLAIAEMLASMKKPAISLVLGGGHSIGVPIAVATDFSFIAESASMTIHPIRLTGLILGIPQSYEYLDRMQERVINFVAEHAEISPDEFKDLMFRSGELVRDIGTVLIGRSAVEEKLIDEVGGLKSALDRLEEMITENGEE